MEAGLNPLKSHIKARQKGGLFRQGEATQSPSFYGIRKPSLYG